METQTILNKRISFCPNVQAKSYKSISLFEALNSIRTGNYEKQIGNIRRLLINNNIQYYKAKKKQLPAYIFSGIAFGNRYKFDISGYTSLIVVDIDKLENIELVKSQLKSDCHVISVWLSPSGNGLKALFYVEYASPIKEEEMWVLHEHCAFPQIENYLFTKYGIQVDRTGADITRLCFVSSDSDIHLKREFEPFTIDITLTSKQIWNIKRKYYYGRKNVRNAVIAMKALSNRSLNSFDTNDGNTSQILFHPYSTNELRIPDMCNKLHHVYSRICIFINCVNYKAAERLIETAEELITTLNEMSKKGITKKELSIMLWGDTDSRTFAYLENRKNISSSVIEKIADILDCNIDDLFERENRAKSNIEVSNNIFSSINVNSDPQIMLQTINLLNRSLADKEKEIERLGRLYDKIYDIIEKMQETNKQGL